MRNELSVENIVKHIESTHCSEVEITKVVTAASINEGQLRDTFIHCAEREFKIVKEIVRGQLQVAENTSNLSYLIHEMTNE